MKTFRLLSAIMFAGVCLSMASCIDSKNPVSDPEKAKVDQKLLGAWRMTDKDGNVYYYHVGLAGGKSPGGLLQAISVAHGKDGTISKTDEPQFFFSSILGGNCFLSIANINEKDYEKLEKSGWDAKLVQGYAIFKYEIKDDTLTLWIASNDDIKRKAIQAGKIKGEIKKSKGFFSTDSIFFTDTSENLAKFLADPENANLFDLVIRETFQRVK